MKPAILRPALLAAFASTAIFAAFSARAQSPTIDFATAQRLFKDNVHPFLRQRCVSCHGEQATWPAGPVHSHSDAAAAFPVFMRFFDVANPGASRIVRMARNRHFCDEDPRACSLPMQTGEELALILAQYAESLRRPSAPTAATGDAAAAENVGASVAGGFGPIVRSSPVVMSDPTSVQAIIRSFVFPSTREGSGPPLTIEAAFVRHRPGYLRLTSLKMNGPVGFWTYSGLQIWVNGLPYPQQIGLESVRRSVGFYPVPPRSRRQVTGAELLAPRSSILRIPDGATVEIALGAPTRSTQAPVVPGCGSAAALRAIDARLTMHWADVLVRSGEPISPALQRYSDSSGLSVPPSSDICFDLASRINPSSPVWSPLLGTIANQWANSRMDETYVEAIESWLQADSASNPSSAGEP